MIVRQMKEPEILQLEGKMLSGLFMHCIHTFELTPQAERKTKFTCTIQLDGFLPNMMPIHFFDAFYDAMNQAFNESLKEYVETEEERHEI